MQQAPIVTLILGLVTAIITAVTLIATKENKISEFRQSWIDGQRADLAAAIAAAQGFLRNAGGRRARAVAGRVPCGTYADRAAGAAGR
ncbi:Uncharacterised protein [Sphingomonas paucimobilis]|nr:Uncharacterised protein [Sphingomonas paucimobilis]